MPKPQAPDPNGDQPEDWEPRHWIAYTHWATGHTRKQTAQASGYSTGHLGRLYSEWRNTYNTDNITYTTPGMTPEINQAGVQQHAIVSRLRWKARRADLADNLGNDIEDMRALVASLITHYTKPENLTALTIKDARDLVAMMVHYAKIADQAADIPDATRALTLTQNTIQFGEPGPDSDVSANLLDGLMVAEAIDQSLHDAIDVVARGFLTEISDGDMQDNVLDVKEAS